MRLKAPVVVWLALAAVLLLALVVGAGTALGASWLPWTQRARTAPAAQLGGDGIQSFDVPSAAHVTVGVRYPQDPPVGGPHSPAWLNCGFYPVPVSNEQAVHSLEHGAVWITYRPDLPAAQQETLRQLVHDPAGRGYVLASAYPTLPADTPVVASAWGRQLRLHTFDEPALRTFIRLFAAGPQTPEPGAPCTGGVGEPQ